MGLESGGGGAQDTRKHRPKKGGGNPIPTAPSRPASSTRPPSSGPVGGGGHKKRGGHKAPGSGGGRSGGGGMAGYEKRAQARANADKRKAANRYNEQAANLEAQARALKHALRIDFKKGLHQQLSDITESLRDQNATLLSGYRERYGQLEGATSDNEKAQADQSTANLGNRVRERSSALGEATAQGAGETDLLSAQIMSLRNWNANQGEVERGYQDTLRSINSSLTDLNVDTKTALVNNVLQANADREQLWTNYYDQRGEAWTQIGNIRGQQADYYAMAAEMGDKNGQAGNKNKGKNKGHGGGKQGGKGKSHDRLGARMAVPENEFRKGQGSQLDRWQPQRKPAGGKGNFWSDLRDRGQKAVDQQRKKQRHKNNAWINATADNAKEARQQSEKAFMNAAKESGKSWDNPGVPDRIMDWTGKSDFEEKSQMSRLAMAPRVQRTKAPEGATLRKW